MAQVEREVNEFIRQNAPVETRIMTPDDARDLGAQALFGEKYGDEVRVVSMGTLDGSGKGTDGRPIRWSFAAAPMCADRRYRRLRDHLATGVLGGRAPDRGADRGRRRWRCCARATCSWRTWQREGAARRRCGGAGQALMDDRKLENEVASCAANWRWPGAADRPRPRRAR
jgi:alanyl-tRNA synthetase